MNDATWRMSASCATDNPEKWFPLFSTGAMQPHDLRMIAEAKAICGACPVRAECLESAMQSGERWGIWGGLTPEERGNAWRKHRKTEGAA